MSELAGIEPRPHASFPHTYSTYITLSVIPIASDEAPHPEIIGKSCLRRSLESDDVGAAVLLPAHAVFPSSINGCLE